MVTTAAASAIEVWPIDQLDAAIDNPRRDLGDLEGLAASIREVGIMMPLLATPAEDTGRLLLVAGHRRLAAGKLAGLETVEVIVEEGISTKDRLRKMLIENLHRADLSPLDKAKGFADLAAEGLSQREIAEQVGVSQSQVSKHLSLLKLDEGVQVRIAAGEISQEAAVALAGLDKDLQNQVLLGTSIEWGLRRQEERVANKAKVKELQAAGVRFLTDDERVEDFRGSVGSLYWLTPKERKSHLTADCRAVWVNAAGEPMEYCTAMKNHPRPKESTSGRGQKGETAAERAKREEIERLRGLLSEAAERRVAWIKGITSTPALTTAAAQIMLRCDAEYFDTDLAAEMAGVEVSTDIEFADAINTEQLARRGLFALACSATETLMESSYGAFEASEYYWPQVRAYLEILTALGYEVSWIESKFAGLPYEEPQMPGTASPAAEDGASDAEDPTITFTVKKGKHYASCTSCGHVGYNSTREMCEERAEAHLLEKHGIGRAA